SGRRSARPTWLAAVRAELFFFLPTAAGIMKTGMKATVRRLVALAGALAAMSVVRPAAVHAQAITTGTIEVHVTDETKAVLPGVSVTLTNPDTGLIRNGVSDARGVFQFLNLPVANNYDDEVELAGF